MPRRVLVFDASFDPRNGALVVKLPRDRVTELVDSGTGDPFAPSGREWVSLPEPQRDLWQRMVAEAREFVSTSD